jgi:uncharacterized protein YkwD
MRLVRHPPRLAVALAAAALLLLTQLASGALAGRTQGQIPWTRSDVTRYAGFLAPDTACPGQGKTRAPFVEQKESMRCLLNWARRRIGLRPLRHSRMLDNSSTLKADAIGHCRDFSHTACGRPFAWAFQAAGYLGARSWDIAANIPAGSAPSATPRRTLVAWLNSAEHRHNLLDPQWHDMGIAVVRANGVLGLPNATVWVNQFGRRS